MTSEADDKLNEALSVSSLVLPPRPTVKDIKWEWYEEQSSGATSEDELAIWVEVFWADDTVPEDNMWEALEPIDETIRAAVAEVDPDIFPYIDFLRQSGVAA